MKSVGILFFKNFESIKIENRIDIGHWHDLSSFEFTNLKSFRILETETKLLIGCIKNPVGKAYQWQEHEESELDRVHILHEKNSNMPIRLGTVSVLHEYFMFAHSGSFQILETETKLLIGCVKNPVGKATNGRNMKKVNWTGYIFYTKKKPTWPIILNLPNIGAAPHSSFKFRYIFIEPSKLNRNELQ